MGGGKAEGNEGDAIIFVALKQFGIVFPEDLNSVGQLTPELLVSITVVSLERISNGEIQVYF
jgi:hypothetical protein